MSALQKDTLGKRHRGIAASVRLVWAVTILAAALVQVPGEAAARTWRVERDGSGDSVTIQPAVNAAAPGDTIWIDNGRYREYETSLAWGAPARDVYVLVGTDNLTFIGEAPDSVKIGPDVAGSVRGVRGHGPCAGGSEVPRCGSARLVTA